jgi:hypothetical protein
MPVNTGDVDTTGCTIVGTAVVPGASDQSGTSVFIEALARSTLTAADGTFTLTGLPLGTYALSFQNGSFHEFLDKITCDNFGGPDNLKDPGVMLYRGVHVSAHDPIGLPPVPRERAIDDGWVIDRNCGPATQLDCVNPQVSDDQSVAACIDSVVAIGADPSQVRTLSTPNAAGTVGRSGRYVLYATSSSVHLVDVSALSDRMLGTLARYAAPLLAADEEHVVFFDTDGNLDIFATHGDVSPHVVQSFTLPSALTPPPLTPNLFLLLSPDGKYIAFADPACQTNCELFVSDMAGNVHSAGTQYLATETLFSPDSQHIAFTSTAGGYSLARVAAGEGTRPMPAASTPFSFVSGGAQILYGSSGGLELADADTLAPVGSVPATQIYGASPDGRWVFVDDGTALGQSGASVSVLDVQTLALTHVESALHLAVLFAPDSKSAAFVAGATQQDFKRIALTPALTVTTVGSGDNVGAGASFSPDGRWLAFSQNQNILMADRSGPGVVLMTPPGGGGAFAWLGTTGLLAGLGGLPDPVQAGLYLLFPPD